MSRKTSGKTSVNTESVTIFADPGTSTKQRDEKRLVVQNEYGDDCIKQERITDIGTKVNIAIYCLPSYLITIEIERLLLFAGKPANKAKAW